MNLPSPYNYNLPVGQNLLFGRQSDLDAILYSVLSSPGDSCTVIGGRRIGKTSLLEAILRELESQESDTRFIGLPIFLDFSGEEIKSVNDFFIRVSDQSVELLQNNWHVEVEPLNLSNNQPAAPAFERLLLRWDKAVVDKHGRTFRLILLLDECEQIAEREWATHLYGSLRQLLDGRRTRSLMKIIMAGAHRFLSRVRQEGSPLRNILRYYTLYALDIEATRQLINDPTNQKIPVELISYIAEQTGGHPFLTQYLMSGLWNIGLDEISHENITKVTQNFLRERGDFQDWLDGLGESAYSIYLILAKANMPLDEQEIRRRIEVLPSDFLQALEALCYHGIVAREQAQYRVNGLMFQNWFMTYSLRHFEKAKPAKNNTKENSPQILQQTIIQGSYLDQRNQNIHGTQTNAGEDVKGSIFSGNVNGSINSGDTKISNLTTNEMAVGHGSSINMTNSEGLSEEALLKTFSIIFGYAERLPDGEIKSDVQAALKNLEEEANKGEKVDENRVKKWLNFLAETAPDIWDVAITSFTNPIGGLAVAFRKIAEKAKQARQS